MNLFLQIVTIFGVKNPEEITNTYLNLFNSGTVFVTLTPTRQQL